MVRLSSRVADHVQVQAELARTAPPGSSRPSVTAEVFRRACSGERTYLAGGSTIVAAGNCGRGPVGPCGRDRQILFDYHPKIRVILPTPEGIRNVKIAHLMPLGAVWTAAEGTQEFDPALFEDHSDS